MLKYKKITWRILSALGLLAAAAALALLILHGIRGNLSLIPMAVLLLALAGGLCLLLFSCKALRLLPQTAVAPELSNKQKKLAQESLDRSVPQVERQFSRCISLALLLVAAAVFLGFYSLANPIDYTEDVELITGVSCERGLVLSVDEESYQGQQEAEFMPVGSQTVTVELLSGRFAGNRYQLVNHLGVLYGSVLKEGDRVIVAVSLTDGEMNNEPGIWSLDRTIPLLVVLLLFLLITVLVGGKIGAKSLLGLILTFVCIFAVLIPLLINGWPTLPTILGMCVFVTVVEFTILDGVHKKTVCAMLGTISGVVLAALFAQIASSILRVNGYIMNDTDSMVEALLNFKRTQPNPLNSLQISDLLVGGILIAALGAVNDVAMSISSAMNELIAVNPNLSRKELFRSGMNIGRDMVGTMTNTLILALAGSSLVMLIYYSTLEPTWNELMSSAFLSVEMVQALSSSIGVVLAVPVTVLIGMLFYGHKPKRAK